jgi:virginiamycin B lyase
MSALEPRRHLGLHRHLRRLAIILLAVTAAVLWASAGRVRAAIYWTNWAGGAIGRANVDGTGVSPTFMLGAKNPSGVAIDDQHVYWTNSGGTSIGRANLDGFDIDQSFIAGLPAGDPTGIAVDAHHIYWADYESNSIGRANLGGTAVNLNFIRNAALPVAVAVDARHIYWANTNSLGRANLNGARVNQGFIPNLPQPQGIAVDSHHIYWTNFGSSTISRANLDGTGIDRAFVTGATQPAGLAVADGHIYWTNTGTNTLGRANLDGTNVNQTFIRAAGISAPMSVAVGIPMARASVARLTFGSWSVGDYSPPQSLTVTNTGTAPLKISPVQISSGDARDFLVFYDSCSGNSLRVGASCDIHVRFGPTAAGPRSATLALRSNDPVSPLRVALSGTGQAGAGRKVQLLSCRRFSKVIVKIIGHRHQRLHLRVTKCTSRVVPG